MLTYLSPLSCLSNPGKYWKINTFEARAAEARSSEDFGKGIPSQLKTLAGPWPGIPGLPQSSCTLPIRFSFLPLP